MKVLVALLIAGLASGAETKQEKGRRIVEESLTALGGEKFLKVTDRIETGRAYSFYREQLTGLAKAKLYTRYSSPSGKGLIAQRERQAFGKEEDVVTLFAEDNGYQITYRGAKPLEQSRYKRYVDSTRRNIFYILRERLQEPGMVFEFRETTVWSNTPVDIVDITDTDNQVVSVYFERSTKFPVRQVFFRRNPQTKERDEEVSVFAKYRDVGGGVQWPFSMMSERNGEKVFELYSDSVAVNQGLKEELFSLPGNMKMLPADKSID